MEVEWRKLRADELREAARHDAIVILPVAAIEQHGPHLPVETDTLVGEAVAIGTARKLVERGERALVLPAMWMGLSEHHMPFGGTITLGLPAFGAVIEDICRSLQRHGFRRIVLSNSHGGNINALRNITDDLTIRLGLPIIYFTYFPVAAQAIAPLLTTQAGIQHACEGETAMMLALRPELVARDKSRRATIRRRRATFIAGAVSPCGRKAGRWATRRQPARSRDNACWMRSPRPWRRSWRTRRCGRRPSCRRTEARGEVPSFVHHEKRGCRRRAGRCCAVARLRSGCIIQ